MSSILLSVDLLLYLDTKLYLIKPVTLTGSPSNSLGENLACRGLQLEVMRFSFSGKLKAIKGDDHTTGNERGPSDQAS